MKRVISAIAVIALASGGVRADQMSEANLRNSAHMKAVARLCGIDEASRLQRDYFKMVMRGGEYSRSEASKIVDGMANDAIRDGRSRKKAFCQEAATNMPNFREGIESGSNNPDINIAVPYAAIQRAEADCKAVVFRRESDWEKKLYTDCVQQQIDIWQVQERQRRSN